MLKSESKEDLYTLAIGLLDELIRVPSFSGAESETAAILEKRLESLGFKPARLHNNVWAFAREVLPEKPTILLNSHHDTVKATENWIKDPFDPVCEDGKIFGLGSNDAGGPLVSLFAAFLFLSRKEQPYNLIFAASAEEENSGENGIASVLPALGDIDLTVVGEPTSMRMAIAERGLLVLDCIVKGESGHAARGEGSNALYKAIDDILWFKTYDFPKRSSLLGKVNMSVTQIEAGTQHNVVPDLCKFVVDIRPNDCYSIEEILKVIRKSVSCEVLPRSMGKNPSAINKDHSVVKKARSLGIPLYGSATLSDQVHMKFPSIKIGPGDTKRSHTSDEYILIEEIKSGMETYIKLLDQLELQL